MAARLSAACASPVALLPNHGTLPRRLAAEGPARAGVSTTLPALGRPLDGKRRGRALRNAGQLGPRTMGRFRVASGESDSATPGAVRATFASIAGTNVAGNLGAARQAVCAGRPWQARASVHRAVSDADR